MKKFDRKKYYYYQAPKEIRRKYRGLTAPTINPEIVGEIVFLALFAYVCICLFHYASTDEFAPWNFLRLIKALVEWRRS